MINYARQNSELQPDVSPPSAEEHIAPAPRVSVQVFCETVETAAAVQSAGEDRRLGKAHLKIQMGGMAAAIEAYRLAPTPALQILETEGHNDVLPGSASSPPTRSGTRVIVIGRLNDVALYRELVRRGVSDYMIAPVTAIDVVRSVCNLFSAPEAKAVGRIVAIVGAKGGVGASTIAHNVAWAIARDPALDSVSPSPNSRSAPRPQPGPPQGIARPCSRRSGSIAFIDRLLSKCRPSQLLARRDARRVDFSTEPSMTSTPSHRALHCSTFLSVVRLDKRVDRRRRSSHSRRPISPICATKNGSTCSRPRGRTTARRSIASTRSACRSGRKSTPASSPRPLKPRRSRPFRSSRSCSARPPIMAK
jgi:hypothetical protein